MFISRNKIRFIRSVCVLSIIALFGTYLNAQEAREVFSRVMQEDGIVGKIFCPETTEARPAVIVLTGSNGGINEAAAKAFAQEGYVGLALAYFRAKGVPDDLENIPLEYFLHAIHWLKCQPQVLSEKIHLYGGSRGGELVLLLGSVYPNEIQSIVAVAPFSVTNGGVPNANAPAWTLQGDPLPIAPYPDEIDVLKQLETRGAISFTPLWLHAMEGDMNRFNDCKIRVENINCPILLISGRDDKMCPSWLYGAQIMERLDRFGSKISRTHLCYEGAGHLITNPNFPVTTEALQLPYEYLGHKTINASASGQPKRYYEIGGTPEKQAFACSESWKKIIGFLSGL